ncbi:MAG TPA: VOC family protein [Devosia sp.]|jgi:predicted enzyme related to lactoylglutathione lyase|nr:VOC family protein [Devosia sp.]
MSNQSMTVQGIYACAAAADFERTVAWYSKFMGRAPDDQPMPGMAQWRNMGAAGIQVWYEPEHAGHSRLTIVAPDMTREHARLESDGISLGEVISGDFGKVAQLTDPEGNRIALTEPPKGFVNR